MRRFPLVLILTLAASGCGDYAPPKPASPSPSSSATPPTALPRQEQAGQEQAAQEETSEVDAFSGEHRHRRHHSQPTSDHPRTEIPDVERHDTHRSESSVPDYALEVRRYVREHNHAPEGFEGGREFTNYEGRLAARDSSGRNIRYQEWDVHPHEQHVNRGAERIVTGSDGSAWFSSDHYQTFIPIRD